MIINPFPTQLALEQEECVLKINRDFLVTIDLGEPFLASCQDDQPKPSVGRPTPEKNRLSFEEWD